MGRVGVVPVCVERVGDGRIEVLAVGRINMVDYYYYYCYYYYYYYGNNDDDDDDDDDNDGDDGDDDGGGGDDVRIYLSHTYNSHPGKTSGRLDRSDMSPTRPPGL